MNFGLFTKFMYKYFLKFSVLNSEKIVVACVCTDKAAL